jgi:hypothetical protein
MHIGSFKQSDANAAVSLWKRARIGMDKRIAAKETA